MYTYVLRTGQQVQVKSRSHVAHELRTFGYSTVSRFKPATMIVDLSSSLGLEHTRWGLWTTAPQIADEFVPGVGELIGEIIPDHFGLSPGAFQLRFPGFVPLEATEWHSDLSQRRGISLQYCILWASKFPTWVRPKKHTDGFFAPKPFDIVLVDNQACQHKPPTDTVYEDRFFAIFRTYAKFNGAIPKEDL